MYSTRMHPHDVQEDYNTQWWIIPAIIVGILVMAAMIFDHGEIPELDALQPATAMEPTILYDSAREFNDKAAQASPAYAVPDASAMIASSRDIEDSHAPTF